MSARHLQFAQRLSYILASLLTLAYPMGACAAGQRAPLPPSDAMVDPCPPSLFLETVTVRVYETSDTAQDMLRSACIQAAARGLAHWRPAALANPHNRACAARMGAQGCLIGQAFTNPACTHAICPLVQKCTVHLVRLPAVAMAPRAIAHT
jgi:hypothetical protein